MEFRREMLYDALKVTMEAHGILSSSYRYRVVCEDRRGHQYSVLVDLSADFMFNREGNPEQLLSLGEWIRKNAAVRYNLVVTGVYWRVNDGVQRFEPFRSKTPNVDEAKASGLLPVRRHRVRATADELAAVEAAGQKGQEVRLRNRVYASGLAPLGDDLAEGVSHRYCIA